MSLLQDLFSDLRSYYIQNYMVLSNPNFIRQDDLLTWPNYEPWPSGVNYADYYQWVIDKLQHSFVLEDGSCLQIHYRIKKERIANASLAFVPSPLQVEDRGLVYFRFDCDIDAQRDFVHTSYHVHFGDPDTTTRISLHRFPIPSDFLRFAMLVSYDQVDPRNATLHEQMPNLDDLNCRYTHCLTLK